MQWCVSIIEFLLVVLNLSLKPLFEKADADNVDAAKAILKGLKSRHQEIGIPPIFIQTVCDTSFVCWQSNLHADAHALAIKSGTGKLGHRFVFSGVVII